MVKYILYSFGCKFTFVELVQMCCLHKRNLGRVVEVILSVECDIMIVHTTFSSFLDAIYTGLEAVKAISTLELFEHQILGLELFLIEII